MKVHRIYFPEGNLRKAPAQCFKWTSYYYRDMVEPDKYINNVENLESQLMTKY